MAERQRAKRGGKQKGTDTTAAVTTLFKTKHKGLRVFLSPGGFLPENKGIAGQSGGGGVRARPIAAAGQGRAGARGRTRRGGGARRRQAGGKTLSPSSSSSPAAIAVSRCAVQGSRRAALGRGAPGPWRRSARGRRGGGGREGEKRRGGNGQLPRRWRWDRVTLGRYHVTITIGRGGGGGLWARRRGLGRPSPRGIFRAVTGGVYCAGVFTGAEGRRHRRAVWSD